MSEILLPQQTEVLPPTALKIISITRNLNDGSWVATLTDDDLHPTVTKTVLLTSEQAILPQADLLTVLASSLGGTVQK